MANDFSGGNAPKGNTPNPTTNPEVVTADDVRTANPANTTGMAGDPKAASEGKPTAGLSADAPKSVSMQAPVLDPPPGTVKENQPGKDASGNAHQQDMIAVMGWVDHPNIGVDGTVYNAHSPGMVMRPNPLKHQGEEVPPGDAEANPLNQSVMHGGTPTVHPTAVGFGDKSSTVAAAQKPAQPVQPAKK